MVDDAIGLDIDGLYRLHYEEIVRFAARRAGQAAAADIASETFLIAWRHRHDDVRAPRPWLYAIAHNLMSSSARQQTRSDQLIRELGRGLVDDPDVAEDVSDRDRAISALAGLSDTLRSALELTAWDGLTVTEAAVVLGCTAATLRVRLHRARRQLVKAFNDL